MSSLLVVCSGKCVGEQQVKETLIASSVDINGFRESQIAYLRRLPRVKEVTRAINSNNSKTKFAFLANNRALDAAWSFKGSLQRFLNKVGDQ